MNYELAKKLKDAGFPIDKYSTNFPAIGELCELPEKEHEETCKDYDCKRTVQIEMPNPSLEELIDACEGHLTKMETTSAPANKSLIPTMWKVTGYRKIEKLREGGGEKKEIKDFDLKTAVANLWLEINK